MQLIKNSFLTPYFIFIKDKSKLSDKDLLERLELKNYQLITDKDEKKTGGEKTDKRYLYITEDENWKHLMDDWLYTLWFDKEAKLKIKNLSKEFDIFCCSIGESDSSFDFVFYQNGIIKREYIVEDPFLNGGKVVKNLGEAFDIEEIALSKKDQFEKVLSIADSLGINIKHNLDKIRCYGRLEKESENFVFKEDEY